MDGFRIVKHLNYSVNNTMNSYTLVQTVYTRSHEKAQKSLNPNRNNERTVWRILKTKLLASNYWNSVWTVNFSIFFHLLYLVSITKAMHIGSSWAFRWAFRWILIDDLNDKETLCFVRWTKIHIFKPDWQIIQLYNVQIQRNFMLWNYKM